MVNSLPLKKCFIACVLFSALFVGHNSTAQDRSRTIKLGVVNLSEITRKSLMSKDIARQIDLKRRAFRDEIKKEEENLRVTNDELQKQRVVLAPEALQQKFQALRERSAALQRKVQQRNQEFIGLRTLATREFEKERAKALLDVSKKYKFTLILRQREVLVRADFLDVTELVLNALNNRTKKFKLPDDISKRGK